mgnify:CR=1 FL=1
MPRLLEYAEVDQDAEALDLLMTEDEEAAERAKLMTPSIVGDLSDGGKVGGMTLYPMQNGQRVGKGRPTARQAWMWDGTETTLLLAWNPEGTRSDRGRRYLSKRHCLCCGVSGFRGLCPPCSGMGNNGICGRCQGGTDKSKIIPNFYLRKEDVPFQQKFYGDVDCFIATCPRRGGAGFKTEEDMRMHARSRHRMEYITRQEVLTERKSNETDDLRREVGELRSLLMNQQNSAPAPLRKERSPAQKEWAAEMSRRAKARAAAR